MTNPDEELWSAESSVPNSIGSGEGGMAKAAFEVIGYCLNNLNLRIVQLKVRKHPAETRLPREPPRRSLFRSGECAKYREQRRSFIKLGR